MQAEFRLDGCHSIRISTDVPRDSRDRASVGLQLEYTPLRVPGDPIQTFHDQCGSAFDLPVPPGTKILMSARLRSSEARAIASMLLSAATES